MNKIYEGKPVPFHPQPVKAEEDFQRMVCDPLDSRSNDEKWKRACIGRGITDDPPMPTPCKRASTSEIIEELSNRRDGSKVRIDLPSGD